LSSWLLFPVKV